MVRGWQRCARAGACIIGLAVFLTPAMAFAASTPNPSLTPGAADPRVTQSNVSATICRSGYTSTVRNVSTQTKHTIYVAYGINKSAQRNYVIDHLIPLEVGGANDIKNLWPEPKADAKVKDKLENQMHVAVCSGAISLAGAQGMFTNLTATATPATPNSTPPAETPPATQPPTTSSPAPAAQVVHPGAFCAPQGATGVTTAGTAMVCGPASDGRNRWHAS